MSSAVTNTNTTVTSSANTTATNPNGQLTSSDFMQLLLTELQQQDPTSPMDTDKMLSQTSELSTLQAQTATTQAMTAMTTAFQNSAGFTMSSSIGRLATVGDGSVALTKGSPATVEFYLPEAATNTQLLITDSTGNNVITTMNLGSQPANSVQTISWDGTNTQGVAQDTGTYMAKVIYNDANGAQQTVTPGKLPISSIKFGVSGATQMKVGTQYYNMSQISEISDN